MSRPNTRVLVVDDSAVIRAMISDVIQDADGFEVVGTASNGRKALATLDSLRPDVITLDLQMPEMNGLETLDAILACRPTPVIIVSALTRAGAAITLEALDRGAIDYVAKPQSGADVCAALGHDLLRKIRDAAGADVRRILEIRRHRKIRRGERLSAKPPLHTPVVRPKFGTSPASICDFCIAIGISTGGPPALSALFEAMQPPLPPIVVVQHMPPQFTGPLSWRLNTISALSIKEAAAGDILRPNHVFIAPGGKHLRARRQGSIVKLAISDGAPVSGHKPSIDVMMTSIAETFGSRALGVIMTGMGRDGCEGCRQIRQAGGYILGQDEATSDVYGMNKIAFVQGHVDRQFALDEAAAVIGRQVRSMDAQRAARGRSDATEP